MSTSALPTLRQALCQLPSSVCTAGPRPASCPAQCALLDLKLGAAQLSVHRWTSTWELPSSVCTTGPQPGTCPAQCAPLDLNRGPAQLSVHRWTSTWDLPSSVCTAGPQPGTCPAQCAPLDLNGQIECQKICQMECQIERQKICQIECQIECQKICQIECQKVCQIECQIKCQIECQKICQIKCHNVCQIECRKICQIICQKIWQIECQIECRRYADMPEDMPGRMPEDMPGRMPEDMPEGMPDRMPDKMPDRMAEDLPVTKFINVMVGITRSKVIYIYNMFLLYFSDLVQNLSLQADLLFFELCGQMSDISQQSHEYRKLCLWSESHCEDLLSIEDSLSSFLRWSDCTSILSAWRCPMKRYGTELLAPSCTNFAPYNSAS